MPALADLIDQAAAAAMAALQETSTLDAARRALGTFADEVTANAAANLLRELAGHDDERTPE